MDLEIIRGNHVRTYCDFCSDEIPKSQSFLYDCDEDSPWCLVCLNELLIDLLSRKKSHE